MGRQRRTLQATIPGDLLDWMDLQVKERVYHHRSHLVEVAILRLRTTGKPTRESGRDRLG